jgi:acetyltransferase-like isoleucine patch superfamily enzyme/dTDP-4-dehydrorhamnose 3,5-epimerase-like enzyme
MNKNDIYIHPKAIVEPNTKIGNATRVWAFAHILSGAIIGENCNICDGVFIENDVKIGDRVTVKCGVQLWNGIEIKDDVFIGPNATFTNDPFPRSKSYLQEFPNTIIHKGASIGANATILPGITIGANAMIGAGSVVTRDVPQNAIVYGNPARINGYISAYDKKTLLTSNNIENIIELSVNRAKIIKLPKIFDLRGGLIFGEYDKHLPFSPKRFFVISSVPTIQVRGEHAHKEQHQLLICLQGTCSIVLDDGINREEIELNSQEVGLYIPPMIWGIQYKYSANAILLVLASDIYDPEDYIRDYDQYLDILREKNE